MKSIEYTIQDAQGIHARPAGLLIKKLKEFSAVPTLTKDGKSAEAKKLMALMGLGVKCGDPIEVQITGEDEDKACEELKEFFEKNL